MIAGKESSILHGKTILITGSSRGIGEATARLARQYDARVILHGRTPSDQLKKLSSELESDYISCDVSDYDDVVEAVKGLGAVDILVNNAGVNPSKTFMQLTDADWRGIFDVNVFGVVNFSRAVIPGMMERKSGKIVNIASIKGFPFVSGKPAYAAAKAAVMRMTSSMSEEFAPHNIQVNAVAPGFVETSMTRSTLSPQIQSQIDNIPSRRMAQPVEIAEAVLFLASSRADYITGHTLPVDGGLSTT